MNGEVKVSFILLAHERPDRLEQLIVCLLSAGSNIYVHYDAKSKHSLERESRDWGLEKYQGKIYFAERLAIHWGEFSVVRGTLNCLYRWSEVGDNCDYLMLISGSCLPIKPLDLLSEYLSKNPVDHIEAVPASANKWVSHGNQEERWSHYNFIGWRTHPRLFKFSHQLQSRLGINRQIPGGYKPYIGSQWWCLRSSTVERLLRLLKEQPELERFFRHTWVPDETFFQTLVANSQPVNELSCARLTTSSFNSRGVAEYQYNDAFGRLMGSDGFFARKISPHATELKKRLRPVFEMTESEYREYRSAGRVEAQKPYGSEADLIHSAALNTWHAFAVCPELAEDFCASIPNRIVVICGGSWDRRKALSEQLSKSKHISAYGHLFNADYIDFGGGVESVAGYGRDHHSLAQHRWPFFLGDVCKENPGKTVVFCLGDNAVEYLKVLKYKVGLLVLLLEDAPEDFAISGDETVAARRRFSTRMRLQYALSERYCSLHRLSDEHDEVSILSRVEAMYY